MGRASLVAKLLSLGADVSTRLLVDAFPTGSFTGPGAAGLDCGGETPLHAAARLRTTTLAAALIKAGADVNARCGTEASPTTIVADATPLYWAVRCCNLATVQLLLAKGADPRARHLWKCQGQDVRTWTLLHLVASQAFDPAKAGGSSCEDFEASRGAIISVLVTAGADVNAVDLNGNSALHIAALFDCRAAVIALLAAGADAEVRDARGETPVGAAKGTAAMSAFPVLVL